MHEEAMLADLTIYQYFLAKAAALGNSRVTEKQ